MRRAAPRRGINDQVPVRAMQTYSLLRPAGDASWWREGLSCEDVDCDHARQGWVSLIDEGTDLGQRQAAYIRTSAGRRYDEHRRDDGLTVFTFAPGQRCFRDGSHRLAVEREPLYVVRGGDHRGNPERRSRVHTRGEFWVEDFAENQDTIQTVRKRG